MKKFYFNRTNLRPDILKATYQPYQIKNQMKFLAAQILSIFVFLILIMLFTTFLFGLAVSFKADPNKAIMPGLAILFISALLSLIIVFILLVKNINTTKVKVNKQSIKIQDWRYQVNDTFYLEHAKVSYRYLGRIDDFIKTEELRLIIEDQSLTHEYILTGTKRQIKKLMQLIDNQFI